MAPVSGIVHDLQVNTVGAVVSPGQTLMSLIPVDEKVVVEARILPADIGHVRAGQQTKVTISGFEARRYGTIFGELTQISPSSFTDESGEIYFSGRIVSCRRFH